MNLAIIIMGVSGSGKSTVGKLLSDKMKATFIEGDDYHSKENKIKLSSGIALQDSDRLEWLRKLNFLLTKSLTNKKCVLSCSSLKKSYRNILTKKIKEKVKFVYLHGSHAQIKERLSKRKNHFMSISLLNSQLRTLEIPKNSLRIDISLEPEEIIGVIKKNILDK